MLGALLYDLTNTRENIIWSGQNNFSGWKQTSLETQFISERLSSIIDPCVLFYPSCGLDISDIVYVNGMKIPEMKDTMPNVFIHSDRSDYFWNPNGRKYNRLYGNQLNSPVFIKLESYHWDEKSEREIFIDKYKRNGLDNDIWFIYLKGFCNEVALKSFIKRRIKVDVIYSPCDGITSGMGVGDCNNIPTLFYPLLGTRLGIKYHISDQSIKNVLSNWDERPEEFRNWIKHINNLDKTLHVDADDVKNIYNLVNEIELNNDDSLKIFTPYRNLFLQKSWKY